MKLRSLAFAGLLAVAVSANAATLIFNHSGVASQFFGQAYFSASPTYNNLGSLPTNQINFLYDPVSNTTNGQIFDVATFSVIDFTTDGTGFTLTNSLFESSVANVKLYNGLGIFSGLVGTGTLSVTRTYANQIVQGGFSADLEAVPEPASMAALALGFAALAKKRRK